MVVETVQYVRLVGIMITPQPVQSVHLYRFLQFNIQVSYAFHWKSYLFYSLSFTEACSLAKFMVCCQGAMFCLVVPL